MDELQTPMQTFRFRLHVELKGTIRGRLHEAGWPGEADWLGLPGSRHVCETLKINFAITWKNLSPASWDPGIAMPGSRLAGLKIYHVIAISGPARVAGTTLSRH